MKMNRPIVYFILFIGVFAILVGFDYRRSGSFEWIENFMQSSFITAVYILLAGKMTEKKAPES